MKCDSVDNLIIGALMLTVIADSLALFTELLNQRCEKKAEREQEKEKEKGNQEIEDLRKRITLLERQIGTVQ